jgi:hypothetical protein
LVVGTVDWLKWDDLGMEKAPTNAFY